MVECGELAKKDKNTVHIAGFFGIDTAAGCVLLPESSCRGRIYFRAYFEKKRIGRVQHLLVESNRLEKLKKTAQTFF